MQALGSDCQVFHPPLIRLQQTAPNPRGRQVLWLLCALLAFLLCWMFLGRLDVVAVADGRLIPASHLQIVQPAEAGIVSEILVHEGEHVRAGQVLMRMDALLAEADLELLATERARRELQLERVDAELSGEDFKPTVDPASPLSADVLAQYRANRLALEAALAEERSRLERARQELAIALEQQRGLEAVLPHYREQDGAYEKLSASGFAGQLTGSDKHRERIEKEQQLAAQQHLLAAARASIAQSERRLVQIEADYRRNLHAERAELRTQLDRIVSDLDKQHHRRQLLQLQAPQDGVIKELATHTRGTVVQPGTVLASLVPQDEMPKAEVWISNEDIGFVHPGQKVKLKFATYRFQKYGMGEGTVEHVSADVQADEELRGAADPYGRGPLRYRALVALHTEALEADGNRYPLGVGMQLTAEILLGSRTVADYLLSPIRKAWHEAGRER